MDGVSNPGGNVDLIQTNAITITPNDGANTITFGETHSARPDNPHSVTAAQTGALVSVDGVSNAGGDVDFVAGSNMTITPNDGANTVTFSSTAGGIGGSGTTNYVPKFTASTTLGNSAIYQSGSSVGIGTTSPSGDLEINDESGEASIIVASGLPENGQAFISFTQTDEGDIWSLGADDESDRFTISESGSLAINPRLTIYKGGDVGIGIPTPGYKLHVNGNFYGTTVNTGYGNNELYAMNQNVRTSDAVTFATVNTGYGNNELYAMNQNVRTGDIVSFNRAYLNDYGYALGGFHVGGSSDPGTDRLIVDGDAGIGVTPADRLDVNGDVRVRGGDIKDA
ncbi:MAG: hypothetical protein GTO40_07075, partial [Deltaproteobacteria bacterium]|nr:hypothetical protein [Deltaproteobacteria bacterium]